MSGRLIRVAMALMGLAAALPACGSSNSAASSPDTGSATDAGDDAKGDAASDTGSPDGETAGGPDRTVGLKCKVDDDCDVTHGGNNRCSPNFFAEPGSVFPEPVCVGGCDPGSDPNVVRACDPDDKAFTASTRGVCVPALSGGICYPHCTWNPADATSTPTGCVGKNVCLPYAWGASAGKLQVVGVCFGGCSAESECWHSDKCAKDPALCDKCQTETGLCVKQKRWYNFPKSVGDPCVKADYGKSCNCAYSYMTGKGYCTQSCRMGDSKYGCPAGFECDAQLPLKDPKKGDKLFSQAPQGLGGQCFKKCKVDGDCTNGYCDQNAGPSGKTCQPGVRPI